jgi:voltage-gated potassium channel
VTGDRHPPRPGSARVGDDAGDAGSRPEGPGLTLRFSELRLPRWYRIALTAACVLTVPAAIAQFDAEKTGGRDLSFVLNFACWAVFTGVIVLAAIRSGRPRHWIRQNPLDVAVLVLSIPLFPFPMQLLRALWLVRLVRTHGLSRLVFSGQAVRYTVVALVVTVVGGGSLFAALEHIDVGLGLYWATTTVTTVGYGDVTPTTDAGRILAMAVMSAGILSLGFLTAAASERWMASARAAGSGPDAGPPDAAGQAAVLMQLQEISARLTAIEARLDEKPAGPATDASR